MMKSFFLDERGAVEEVRLHNALCALKQKQIITCIMAWTFPAFLRGAIFPVGVSHCP